jgi:hypothetical protein
MIAGGRGAGAVQPRQPVPRQGETGGSPGDPFVVLGFVVGVGGIPGKCAEDVATRYPTLRVSTVFL